MRHLREDQDNKGSLQKTHWRSHTPSSKFWLLDNCRSQMFLVQDVNLETITDTLLWYKIGTSMNSTISVQNKNFLETEKSLQKFLELQRFLEPTRKPKDTYTDNSLELAKFVKTYPGIIERQHLTVQKQMVLLKEWYEELRKGLLQCCCNQRRHFGRRHGGVGKDGRIGNPRWGTQNEKEVTTPKNGEHLIFPIADRKVKLSGGRC